MQGDHEFQYVPIQFIGHFKGFILQKNLLGIFPADTDNITDVIQIDALLGVDVS